MKRAHRKINESNLIIDALIVCIISVDRRHGLSTFNFQLSNFDSEWIIDWPTKPHRPNNHITQKNSSEISD